MRNLKFAVVLVMIAMVGGAACAARGPRNKVRVSALTVASLAVDLYRAEQTVYAGNVPGYGKPQHEAVARGVLKVQYAANAYVKAALDYPADGSSVPATVAGALKAVNQALDELALGLPAIEGVRLPVKAAIEALRAALNSVPVTARDLPSPMHSELPASVMTVFALMQLAMKMYAEGKLTVERLRAFLKKEGATDAELIAAGTLLDQTISALESELNSGSARMSMPNEEQSNEAAGEGDEPNPAEIPNSTDPMMPNAPGPSSPNDDSPNE